MFHAKKHHLTVDLTMWWAFIDCMCHVLRRGHFKHAVLLYNQFKNETSGGNIVKHQTMQCDLFFCI